MGSHLLKPRLLSLVSLCLAHAVDLSQGMLLLDVWQASLCRRRTFRRRTFRARLSVVACCNAARCKTNVITWLLTFTAILRCCAPCSAPRTVRRSSTYRRRRLSHAFASVGVQLNGIVPAAQQDARAGAARGRCRVVIMLQRLVGRVHEVHFEQMPPPLAVQLVSALQVSNSALWAKNNARLRARLLSAWRPDGLAALLLPAARTAFNCGTLLVGADVACRIGRVQLTRLPMTC